MHICLFVSIATLAGLAAGCKARNYNTSSDVKDDDKKATEIDPMAYNAFTIWLTGKGDPVFAIPQGYEGSSNGKQPDGVFYINRKSYLREYSDDSKFVGAVTEGASYKNGVLEYPKKDGRELKLKVEKHMNVGKMQLEAIKYCESKQQRMVTAQELFDFCSLYKEGMDNGVYFDRKDCLGSIIWSVSLVPGSRDMVWGYKGLEEELVLIDRPVNTLSVVCAGKP